MPELEVSRTPGKIGVIQEWTCNKLADIHGRVLPEIELVRNLDVKMRRNLFPLLRLRAHSRYGAVVFRGD